MDEESFERRKGKGRKSRFTPKRKGKREEEKEWAEKEGRGVPIILNEPTYQNVPIYSQKQRELQLKYEENGNSLSADEKRELRLERMREAAKLRRALATPQEIELKRISSLFISKNETSKEREMRRAITSDSIKANRTPEELAQRIAHALGINIQDKNRKEAEEEILEASDNEQDESEDESYQKMLPHETVGEWAVRLAQSALDRKSNQQSSCQRTGQIASARAKARIRFTHESIENKSKRLIKEAERRKILNENPVVREKRLAAQRLRARVRRANETAEELKNRRAREAARKRRQRKYETSEEKEARRKSQSEFKKARYAKMSPEELEEARRNRRNSSKTAKLLLDETPEEALKRKEKRALREQQRRERLTPEQLKAEMEMKRVKSLEGLKKRREKESPEETANRKAKACQMAKDRKIYQNGEFDLFLALESATDPARKLEDDTQGQKVINWWNGYKACRSKMINELKIWREITWKMFKEKEEIKEESVEAKRERLERNNKTFTDFFRSNGEALKKHLLFRREKVGVYFKNKQQRFWDSLTPQEKEIERERRNAYARKLWKRKKLKELGLQDNEEEEDVQAKIKTRGPRKRASTDFWFSKNFKELPADFKAPPRRRHKKDDSNIGIRGIEETSNAPPSSVASNSMRGEEPREYQITGNGLLPPQTCLDVESTNSSSCYTLNQNVNEDFHENEQNEHGFQDEESADEWIPLSYMDINQTPFTTQGNNFGNNLVSQLGTMNNQQNGTVFNENNQHNCHNEYANTSLGFPNSVNQSLNQNQIYHQQLTHQNNVHQNGIQQQPLHQIFNQQQHEQQPSWNNNYSTQENNSPLNYSLQFHPNAQVSLVGVGGAGSSSVMQETTWPASLNNLNTNEGMLHPNYRLNVPICHPNNQMGVAPTQPLQSLQFSSPKKRRERRRGMGEEAKSRRKSASPKKAVKCRKKCEKEENGETAPGTNESEAKDSRPKVIIPHPLLAEIGKRVNSIRPKCPHCFFVFKSEKMIDRHVRHVHETPESKKENREDTYIHICKICSRSFCKKTQLAHHYWFSHYEINPAFECPTPKCEAKYRWLSHLKKHILTNHPKQFDEFCMKKIRTDTASRMFRCTKCPVVFKGFLELNDHFISSHNNSLKIYTCDHCGIVLRMKDHMSEHVIRFHSIGRNEDLMGEEEGFHSMNDLNECQLFRCTICECYFVTADYLREHKLQGHPVRNESESEHPCTACDRPYNNKNGMKSHLTLKCPLANVHCIWCGSKIPGFHHFFQHFKQEHPQEKLTIYKVFGFFKPYKCELCRMSFSSIIGMRNHFDARHIPFLTCAVEAIAYSTPKNTSEICEDGSSTTLSKDAAIPTVAPQTETLEPSAQLPPTGTPEEDPLFHSCSTCNASFTAKEFHRIHKTFQKRIRTNCFICNRNFCKPQGLHNHNKNVHQLDIQKIPLDCLDEGSPETRDSPPLLKLISHDVSITKDDAISGSAVKCTLCLNSASSVDFHKQHWAIGNGPDANLKPCEFCGQSFVTYYTLSRHQKFLHSKELSSSGIGSSFNEPDPSTVVILKNVGSDTALTVYKCVFCLNNYKSAEFLEKHLEKEHPYRDPKSVFPCVICNKNFSRHATLLRHRRAFHNESKKTYQCPHCPIVLSRAEHLTGHLKRFHEGPDAAEKLERWLKLQKEKPFKCEICSNLFASQEKLDSHLTNIHYAEHFSTFCEFCGKQIRPENLLQHVRHVHPEEAPGKRPNNIYQKRPLSEILELISSLQIRRKVRDKKQSNKGRKEKKSEVAKRKKESKKCVRKIEKGESSEEEEEKELSIGNSSDDEGNSTEGEFLFEEDSSEEEETSDEELNPESDNNLGKKKLFKKVNTPLIKIVIKPKHSKQGKNVENKKKEKSRNAKKGAKGTKKRDSSITKKEEPVVILQRISDKEIDSIIKNKKSGDVKASKIKEENRSIVRPQRNLVKSLPHFYDSDEEDEEFEEKKIGFSTKMERTKRRATRPSVKNKASAKPAPKKSKSKVRKGGETGLEVQQTFQDKEEGSCSFTSQQESVFENENDLSNLQSSWIEIETKYEIKEESVEQVDLMEFDPFTCTNSSTYSYNELEMENEFAIHPI